VFLWKTRGVRPQPVDAASPLLEFIAGEFAARIAGVWPKPYAAFLAAPAARRHLVCLAFTYAPDGAPIDVDGVLGRTLRRTIHIAVPAAPAGLARALERLGERAWSEADYRRLVRMLSGHQTGKILRHRDQIDAGEVRALSLLPETLLEHGLGKLCLNEAAASVIEEAFTAIGRRDGEAAAEALAPRWAAVENLRGLAERVRHDLEPEVVPPPFAGTDRLRPILTKAALVDAASRYKNCLRGHLHSAGSGTSAYYEWMEVPGAVLEITRDRLHGWTLDQARLAENKAVPEPMRTAITQDLVSMGVHIGRSLWQVNDALDDVANKPMEPIRTEAEVIGELFGD
jgi:hypothetical protein